MELDEALRVVRQKLSRLNSVKKGKWTLKEREAVSLLAIAVERMQTEICPVCFGDTYILHSDFVMRQCPACKGTGKRKL